MPLYLFYTMVQKVKMTKNSNQGGAFRHSSGTCRSLSEALNKLLAKPHSV